MAYDLIIRELRAGYGGGEVLRGVTMTARAGEVTALLGLNGSGKTTLLRAAAGLLPARGRVLLGEDDVLALSARRRARRLAYIPQRSRADGGLTALETVLMGANAETPLLLGYGAARRARALDCLARLGAQDWADAPIGRLSEGQRRTVILARALMQRAQACLLDEPDGALDMPRRRTALEAARRMAREEGCAVLCALHDASLALSMCDRVLALCGGRVAWALDMRTADAQEVEAAMRALYGDVEVLRGAHGWAVMSGAAPAEGDFS